MKNIFKISLIISAAVLLSGCIKETFPKGSTVTKEQIGESDEAIGYMLNGVPAAMMAPNAAGQAASNHWDFGISAVHLATEYMLEDIAVLGELGYCWFNGYYLNTYQGADYVLAGHFWIVYYKWIKLVNDVISCAGEIDETTSKDRKKSVGQAHAYRAMFYLDLARMYEPKPCEYANPSQKIIGTTVPIVTEDTTEEMAMNNPRATREEIYRFILSDLAKAEEYLKDGANTYLQPTLAAIYGLYARAYIELGAAYADPKQRGETNPEAAWDMTSETAYKKAAEYSRKVIDLGYHSPLTQAQWEDPKTGFNDGSANSAWIWGLTTSSENLSNLISNIAHRSNEAIFGYAPLVALGVNQALYNKISDNDFRKHSWYDPDLGYNYKLAGSENEQAAFILGSAYNPPAQKYLSLKFRPAEGEMLDYTVANCADWCLMRIEEMYFLEMEAVLNLPDGVEKAKKLLTDFMQKYRYSSYSCELIHTKDAFITEMMLQKRIEFWGEGVLFFDYKRLDVGITRGYAGTNIPASVRFNCKGRSPQWNIVITRREYLSNTAIKHPEMNNPDPSEKIPLWK